MSQPEAPKRTTIGEPPLTFSEFSDHVKETHFSNRNIPGRLNLLAGLVSEAGSILNALKRHFEQDSRNTDAFKAELREELGDTLWYLAAIALANDIDLEEVARLNMKKTAGYSEEKGKVCDAEYSEYERFPEKMQFKFIITETDEVLLQVNGVNIGDRLTDNAYVPDNYKFHDVIHIAFAAILGWSPVLRHILRLKRKSKKEVDENEDGARARIIEEAIAILLFNETQLSQRNNGCRIEILVPEKVDFRLLNIVKRMTKDLEVETCSPKLWESAIIRGYEIWKKLIDNKGGIVDVNFKEGILEFREKDD
ncbi:MAG: nucleotide pyrophosphohydrolase [Alphaproteobacteria bacterium]|nr:MAG: nucleotide pyrophosphohydrolase [Alphaproteobacteria bacterium]